MTFCTPFLLGTTAVWYSLLFYYELSVLVQPLIIAGAVPTLREFISFPMANGKVNLAQRINRYDDFGILILEDDNGDRTDAIARELHYGAEDINKRIFRLWVKGEGLQPVSWATLVSVLQDVGLKALARDIEQVKF